LERVATTAAISQLIDETLGAIDIHGMGAPEAAHIFNQIRLGIRSAFTMVEHRPEGLTPNEFEELNLAVVQVSEHLSDFAKRFRFPAVVIADTDATTEFRLRKARV
jgi:hypothetical protein